MPAIDLTTLPSQQSWNNTMFYAKNFYQPELQELAEANKLGYPTYAAVNWIADNQWLLLAGAASVFALLMAGRGRR